MVDSRVEPIASPVREHNWLKYLSLGFVLFGALVRLVQYLSNRSLWSDEAMLALNIVNRSYQELIKPLDYNQAAPLGFLWIEKLSTQLLGNSEYALRLFPLVSGITALGIVYLLAKRYLSAVGVPIAVALFASLHYLVYYTTEVKQYSSDVMIALLLWFVLVPRWQQLLNRTQTILLGLLGAAAIWVSHPTVLMLAAIEASCLITAHSQRLKILINRLPLYLTWLASFIGFYWLTIRSTLENESLTSSWNRRYPDSLLDFPWLFKALDRFFSNPLGFSEITDGIAAFAFIVGCIALYRRNRLLLLTFTAPFMITLMTSYLHQYPFRQRLVLFLVPFAVFIIAEGIAYLITLPRRQSKVILAIGTFVFVTLLVPAVVQTSRLLAYPEKVEEIRPVMAYVQTQQQPDDKLYVYRSGRVQFLYYAPQFGYAPEDYVLGKLAVTTNVKKKDQIVEKNVAQLKREIKRFQGSRVWFLFCNTSEVEEQQFLALVQPLGRQLDSIRDQDAFAYLYDLTGSAPTP